MGEKKAFQAKTVKNKRFIKDINKSLIFFITEEEAHMLSVSHLRADGPLDKVKTYIQTASMFRN